MMDAAWWIVIGFLVVVVVGSYWLWRRSNEYDDYIDEVAPREYKTPPGGSWPPTGGGIGG